MDDALLGKVVHVRKDAQKMLDFDLQIGAFAIDEVAVQCGTPQLLEAFCAYLKYDHGADHFNSVERDRMKRMDAPRLLWARQQGFDVRFEFLRLPAMLWRLECMAVLGGSAPLHSQHAAQHGDPAVIHASFKCDSLRQYEHVKDVLRQMNTMPFTAEYENSYGQFSYWRVGNYFLKPRVNLRDAPG